MKTYLLDTAENRTDFYLVTIIAITAFLLSCLGALYIFYRTYKQWINSSDFIFFNKRSLSMCYKLPFYTACIGKFCFTKSLKLLIIKVIC
jgi:hypothetical protein